MKRFFFSQILLLSCLLVHVPGFAQEEAVCLRNTVSKSSVPDDSYLLSVAWDIFHPAAGEENGQKNLPQLYPGFLKYHSFGILRDPASGPNGRSEISKYIFYAECQIARVEGTDLIYPHQYHW